MKSLNVNLHKTTPYVRKYTFFIKDFHNYNKRYLNYNKYDIFIRFSKNACRCLIRSLFRLFQKSILVILEKKNMAKIDEIWTLLRRGKVQNLTT